MPITVDELVAMPDLATRVLAGAGGGGARIGWAHVCELAQPWLWVGAGDLVMTTGLGIPADPVGQIDYIERLVGVGAAAVAIGEDMSAPALEPVMLAAADDLKFPVLLTRYEVPFVALAKTVAEASQRAQQARFDRTLRVYDLMRHSSGAGDSAAGLLQALGSAVGCTLYLADPATGRSLLPRHPVPPDLTQQIAGRRGGVDHARVTPIVGGDGTALALLVPGPRPSVLLAVPTVDSPPDDMALQHVAGVVALQRTWAAAERERMHRLGSSLLAQLVDGRLLPDEASSRLAESGLGDVPLLVVACTGRGDPEDWRLRYSLDDSGWDHLLLSRGDVTYAALPDDPAALAVLLEGLPPGGSAAGVSSPFTDPMAAPDAQHQARWALHRARARRLPVVRHGDDILESQFLPAHHDESRAVARRILGPLLDYDAAHHDVLVTSLRVFLEENRSWLRAAARLHVHKQTLVYRMRRVAQLTGRRLDDTGDVAELWLALRAAVESSLLDPLPPTGPTGPTP